MTDGFDGFTGDARPGQIHQGWNTFTQTGSNTPNAAAWADDTGASEIWYLNPDLSALAASTATTVVNVGSFTVPTGWTKYTHTITTPGSLGWQAGLARYFTITNSASTVVAVIAQTAATAPFTEHWWMDKSWVDLANGSVSITLQSVKESDAETAFNALTSPTYKKHAVTSP